MKFLLMKKKKNPINLNNESNFGNNEEKEAPVDLKRHFQKEENKIITLLHFVQMMKVII